jgi:hypothetical protein
VGGKLRARLTWGSVMAGRVESDVSPQVSIAVLDLEAYAKASLKKYRPMAARNEDKKVFSGLL